MTDSMVKAYLARLECPEATEPTVENLFKLHYAHLTHVAYETLDIFNGKGMTPLDTEYLFERIVMKKRGGYCFELNGLFAELLRALGYGVEEYFARWHFGETVDLPMRRHRVLRVSVGCQEYIADVGVGCVCPLRPLELKIGLVQPRNGRDYRIVRNPRLGYVVETFHNGAFVPFYSFTSDPHHTVDFISVHFYCSNSFETQFRTKFFVNVCTGETGRLTIADEVRDDGSMRRVFCVTAEDGTKTETELHGEAETSAVLLEKFGISYPENATQQLPAANEANLRKIRRVAVYLASSFPKNPVFEQALDRLAKYLLARNMTLVFGGSNEGLMGVLAKTFLDNGGKVIGVFTDNLPSEMLCPNLTETYITSTLAERKSKMLELSDAIVAFPGSFGTWDEMFDALSLQKLSGLKDVRPIGVLNVAGFYNPLLTFIRDSVECGITPEKYAHMLCSGNTPEELFQAFDAFLSDNR